MDPGDILGQIEENPPEHFNEGCAWIGLHRFLWHLRIGGVYYENRIYDNWKKSSVQSEAMETSTTSRSYGRNTTRVQAQMIPSEFVNRNGRGFEKRKSQAWSSEDSNTRIATNDSRNFVSCLDLGLHREQDERTRLAAENKTWTQVIWSDRTYAILVLLILWANVFRMVLYLVDDMGIAFMTLVISIVWALQVTCTTMSIFVSCTRRSHFPEFFQKWRELFQHPLTKTLGILGKVCDRHVKVAIAALWTLVAINMISFVFIMLMDDSFSAGMNRLFYVNGYRSWPVIIVSLVVLFFASFAWVAPVTLIIVFCHYLTMHFREFNQVMELHILAAKSGFPTHLNLLRQRHLALCNIVTVLDRNFMATLGLFCGFSIGLMCFILYMLVNIRMDVSVMCISFSWLLSNLGFVAILTFYAANLHIAMHSAGEELQKIQASNITLEQLGQLTLFLAKVNGPPMGFSILGMTVVSRELMLTMLSLLITYAIVLLQFK